MKNLRILIADDHALVRRGAREVLHSRNGWRVVGEAANGREALEKALQLKPDVAVVDIGMPELDGVEVTRQIRDAVPDTKVLVLTMHESDNMVRRALDAGASGYLLKSDLTDSLTKAVEALPRESVSSLLRFPKSFWKDSSRRRASINKGEQVREQRLARLK
jgi:DNA-binding NarL/FixJ family response regulator